MANQITIDFNANLAKFEQSLNKATQKLDNFQRDAVQNSGRISASFVSLGKVLPIAAFTALAAAVKNAISEAEKFEMRFMRIEALVRSTGGSAGRTAQEIYDFSRELARNTLASTEGVMDAAGVLLSFKSVAGDVFDRTLELSQDLASVMGTDLKQSVLQLGKALEDPARNLSNLSRSGVSFTQAQQDMIKELIKANKEFEAQSIILDVIEGQVGGAAKGEAGGLTGAIDSLRQGWSELMVEFGNSGPLQYVTEYLRDAAAGVEYLNSILFPDNYDKLASLYEERATLEEKLNSKILRNRSKVEQDLKKVEQEIQALKEANLQKLREDRDAWQAADEAAEKARLERIAEREKAIQDKLAKDRAKLAEKDRKKAEKDAANELMRLEEKAKQYIKALDPGAVFRDQIDEIEELKALFPELADALTEAQLSMHDNWDAIYEDQVQAKEGFDELRNAIEGWGRDFADTLLDSEGNFTNFIDSIERQLARIILAKTFDPFFSKFGDFVADSIPQIFSSDSPTAIDVSGPFASGGISTGPTTGYLANLHGTEAVVPLPDGSSIPVTLKSPVGSTGGDVIVTIENHGTELSVAGTQKTQGPDGSQMIRVMVQSEVNKMIGNGSLDRTMRSNYGINRTGVAR